MKLINRDTDYAVRALSYILRRKDKIVTAAELVRELDMPRPFLRKILQSLNKNGFLKSQRGKGGGFILAPSDHFFDAEPRLVAAFADEAHRCVYST